MTREPIIPGDGGGPTGVPPPDDDQRLRPQRLREVVGQRQVVERLSIALDAAIKRGDPLGHVLFDGPPGLGKTTLAQCIPNELKVSLQIAQGAAIRQPRDLVPYLSNAEERSVLFIDEIHRLPKAVEEYLYPAMEDYRIDIILGEGINARTINMSIQPFTLIGATTRAGMLTAPLRDRFQLREHLDFYPQADLITIVDRNAAKLSAKIQSEAASELARRSRGTPRIANNHLRWVRDFADSRGDGEATLEITLAAMKMAQVDHLGLGKLDRKYLETLARVFAGGPAGLEAIAHTMNVSPDTLEDEVEPFLLRTEFIVRTARGRIARPRAFEHLGADPPSGLDDQGRLF